MRRLRSAALTTALAGGVVALTASGAGATVPLPGVSLLPGVYATGSTPTGTVATKAFPTLGTTGGTVTGSRSWRVTDAGGNCCETYVISTPQGELVDIAGNSAVVSTDGGASWKQVTYAQPVITGEGTIVVAPNGDLVSVVWDPYTGDHLTVLKYDRAGGAWLSGEQPLHTPLFDRPWLSVLNGPFTDALGASHPYAFLLFGGFAELKSVMHVSYDGFHWEELSVPAVDGKLSTTTVGALPHPAWAPADWAQTIRDFSVTPLNGGGALVRSGFLTNSGCPWQRITPPSTTQSCVPTPPSTNAALRFDSRGALHRVGPADADTLRFETSYDGGVTWDATDLDTPWAGSTIERVNPTDPGSGFYELAVNGVLKMAVVATRVAVPQADGSAPSRDVVYVVDTSGTAPVLREVETVGVGGLVTSGGLAVNSPTARLDFYSVAILPDGRIATGYEDTTTGGSPAIAVETGVTRSF